MTEPRAFADIADNLRFLDDWEDRYRYIIELGQGLAPMPAEEHTPEHKVQGCTAQVWLASDETELDGQPALTFRGDSDAMIVKGLVAVLLALYSGRPASEIAQTDAIAKLDELGLREHLSTQRSNGLVAMTKRIRETAAQALAAS
jgi:cysteine desulfuration protein SufE